jgi:hypothetical protein
MSKRLKTAAELVALLNAELRKQDACTGVSVEAITPLSDEKVPHTWTATKAKSPERIGADSPRFNTRLSRA